MPNTMISGGGIKNGPGTHIEAILFAIQSAYKRGTEVQGPYFRSTIIFDIRAGERPRNTYTTTSSAGDSRGGSLEKMMAAYTTSTPIIDGNTMTNRTPYDNTPTNGNTYGDTPNTQTTNTQSDSNSYGCNSCTYTHGTITGPQGPENYMMKQLYGR